MKKYNVFLFDLDGTLTESSDGIFKCFSYALERYGLEIGENKERLIGPPIVDSFMDFYGLDKDQAMEAMEIFRERYSVKGLYENQVYDGVEEMLKKLNEAGKRVVVATSKPEVFARKILAHFQLDQYFEFIAGAGLKGVRDAKSEVIEYALENCKITDRSEVLMIGDRKHDVLGAHENGLDCLGILYGFGNRAELEEAKAEYIEEHVEDILKYV